MNEKDMQVFFGKYIKDNPPLDSEVYELKFTKGNSISFNAIKKHQVKSLLAVEDRGLYHRITDQPWLKDRKFSYTLKKPFDCFFLAGIKAYLVVWFYREREKKEFIKIRINDFLELKKELKRKSFTKAMALEFATEVVEL